MNKVQYELNLLATYRLSDADHSGNSHLQAVPATIFMLVSTICRPLKKQDFHILKSAQYCTRM